MLADSFMINHKQEVKVNTENAPHMSLFLINTVDSCLSYWCRMTVPVLCVPSVDSKPYLSLVHES